MESDSTLYYRQKTASLKQQGAAEGEHAVAANVS
jgi:hypothetical protein